MFAPVTPVQMQSHTVTFLTLTSVCAAPPLNLACPSTFDMRCLGPARRVLFATVCCRPFLFELPPYLSGPTFARQSPPLSSGRSPAA
ncbi:hypothetical protein R3P38DRAFT_3256245 [Favolaschia claudopus]|uniref:Secreted protein n=1 Tax=Favolaschia claudopus TaxID=2862362 RepID=A0AAW0DGE4_9AGAR